MAKGAYRTWKDEKVLDKKLNLIRELASLGHGQPKIADALGIAKRTFINIKNKHKDVNEAYELGREDFKSNLIEVVIKRAFGMKIQEEDQYIEETPRGVKKRIVKHIKELPPDVSAAKYLLTIYFGREFSDKKFELEIQEKKLEKLNEEWQDANSL